MKQRQLAINLINVDASGEVNFENTQNHVFDVGQKLNGLSWNYEITEVIAPYAYKAKIVTDKWTGDEELAIKIIKQDLANGFILGDPPAPKEEKPFEKENAEIEEPEEVPTKDHQLQNPEPAKNDESKPKPTLKKSTKKGK